MDVDVSSGVDAIAGVAVNQDSTREQLLDAAERLFLAHGLDRVSMRAIVREAGQRNQSALQYHFGNREGLITAIRQRRLMQLEVRRRALLESDLDLDRDPGVRECCALLVRAPFLLCRESADFRNSLVMMGPLLMSSDRPLVLMEANRQATSLQQVSQLILGKLEPLPQKLLRLRIENAQGATLLAISRRARNGESFRGARAELFYNNLVDQLAAMLEAPVSEETRLAIEALGDGP